MKKTLVALAALAATASFAQSSMTISGQIDAGYNVYTSAADVKTNTLGNGPAASRLRFVGSEDMGGGMRANFHLEMQPNFGNGTVSGNVATNTLAATSNTGTGALFNRGAWVGLSNTAGWGEVRIGRQSTAAMGLICGVDQGACLTGFNGGGILFGGTNATSRWISGNPSRGQNGNAGMAASAGNTTNASGAYIGANTGQDVTRVINGLTYLSPNMSGFTAQVQYASGNLASNVANGNGNSTGLAFNYANGPLLLGAVFQTAGADPRQNIKGKQSTFGGTYNFGVARVGAIFQTGSASGAGLAITNFNKESAFAFTVTAPMGAATPYLRIGQHKVKNTQAGAVSVAGAYGTTAAGITSVTDASVFNVGVNYALSKRTSLNLDYARDGAATKIAANTNNPSLFYVGVRHSF